MARSTKRLLVKAGWVLVILILLLNILAIFHAYKFTHYASNAEPLENKESMYTVHKAATLVFGVNNARPVNNTRPSRPYKTLYLQSNKRIECWSMTVANPTGTVILFHGYGGEKASMLDKADQFLKLGYNTLLVDFMGSGGSEGNQTTIGFYEAEEVKTCVDYVRKSGEQNIYLFGTSMGAVAIMKAVSDYDVQPKAIIIECPFGTMYDAVCARFKKLKVPSLPMAGLLVFWGGVENGFWAFGHKPVAYAKNINCPTLLLYGGADEKVSRNEIDEIFANLHGQKKLKVYPLAGHENYLNKYKPEWISDVTQFLSGVR